MSSKHWMLNSILKDKDILTDVKPELSETFQLLFDARDQVVQSDIPMEAKERALKNLSSLAVGFASEGVNHKLVKDAERIVCGCVNRMANAGLIDDDEDRDCFQTRLRERVFLTLACRGSEDEAMARLNELREEAQATINRLAHKGKRTVTAETD